MSLHAIIHLANPLEDVTVQYSQLSIHAYIHSNQPVSYCEQYPISNYSLDIQGPLPETTMQSFVVENFTAMNTILENAVYNFTIVVSNSVGNISTKSRTFCKL